MPSSRSPLLLAAALALGLPTHSGQPPLSPHQASPLKQGAPNACGVSDETPSIPVARLGLAEQQREGLRMLLIGFALAKKQAEEDAKKPPHERVGDFLIREFPDAVTQATGSYMGTWVIRRKPDDSFVDSLRIRFVDGACLRETSEQSDRGMSLEIDGPPQSPFADQYGVSGHDVVDLGDHYIPGGVWEDHVRGTVRAFLDAPDDIFKEGNN